MYEFIRNIIGEVPPEFSIIYLIGTFILFIVFCLLILAPFYIILHPFRRKNIWYGIH